MSTFQFMFTVHEAHSAFLPATGLGDDWLHRQLDVLLHLKAWEVPITQTQFHVLGLRVVFATWKASMTLSMTFSGKPHNVTRPGHVRNSWKELFGSLFKCQWLRPRGFTENILTSQLWAPEKVLPQPALLCGLTTSCTRILVILILL